MKLLFTLSLLVVVVGLRAQPTMVKDITKEGAVPNGGSNPGYITTFNGSGYFSARGPLGGELYKTDGTTAGTKLFKDIFPGENDSNPRDLTPVGSKMFFIASDATGRGLFVTDGTTDGTKRLTAAEAGGVLEVLNGMLIFTASDLDHGFEIWKSDGTISGTAMLKDINPGTASSSSTFSSRFDHGLAGSTLFFPAADGVHGRELWKTDGTQDGTVPVGDFRSGAASFITSTLFVSIGTEIFFIGDDGVHERELWKSDGTLGGTAIVKDLPGHADFIVGAWNNQILFGRFDGAPQVYRTDGSEAGTYKVVDGLVGLVNSTSYGDKLYFPLRLGETVFQLWQTDGTTLGTTKVAEFDNGRSNGIESFGSMPGKVLFGVFEGTFVGGLYSLSVPGSEISRIGTMGNPQGQGQLTLFNGRVHFFNDDGIHGTEPWTSDGTPNGTSMLADINKSIAAEYPQGLTAFNNGIYFATNDGPHGYELWKTDGTESGTGMVKDINPGQSSSYARNFTPLNDLLVFFADDGVHGFELWRSDGTEAGTYLLKDVVSGSGNSGVTGHKPLIRLGNFCYFGIADQLWRTDGTEAGTTLVRDDLPSASSFGGGINDYMLAMGEHIYFFTAQLELWKSDGTEAGTQLLAGINSATVWRQISGINKFFFYAEDALSGPEVWVSDGTSQGTRMTKNVRVPADEQFVLPREFFGISNDVAYFIHNPTPFDLELWRSDGTEQGTYLVKDINPGPVSSDPRYLFHDGTNVYFNAISPGIGGELWKSDGTPEGTVLLKDINPGPNSSAVPSWVYGAKAGRRVYFKADDGVHGEELWTTDGTEPGTKLVADINVGPVGSSIKSMMSAGGKLYFVADDGTFGPELWVYDPTLQQITFDPIPDKTFGEAPFDMSAHATSDLPVQFSIISGPATITDNKLTLTGAGDVTVRASQPGNDEFQPATAVELTFTAAKATQTLSFPEIPEKTYGDVISLTATSTSNLPVTFSLVSGWTILNGNSLTFINTNDVTIRASQAGNDNFLAAAPVDRTIHVKKADQTILVFDRLILLSNGTGGGTLIAEASSGLPVVFSIVSGPGTISGSSLTVVGEAGTTVEVTARASQVGNDNYNPTHLDKVFVFNLISGLESESFGVSLFPNPATSTIVVNVSPSSLFKALVLKDVLGRDVLNMDIVQQETTLDVEKFPRGVYIVRLSGDEKFVYTKRVILK